VRQIRDALKEHFSKPALAHHPVNEPVAIEHESDPEPVTSPKSGLH
jgi:hypothetical protein